MKNNAIKALLLVIFAAFLTYYISTGNEKSDPSPFKLGLDLVGGTHLEYKADTALVEPTDVPEAMSALRTVLEKRLNPYGTSEVQISIESPSVFATNAENEQRVIIELPGVTDPEEAKKAIGDIPVLEFRLPKPADQIQPNLASGSPEFAPRPDDFFLPAELTGRHVEKATVSQDPYSGQILVDLRFSSEGKDIFAEITRENIGNELAIFLDGQVISAPVIQQEIFDGNAQISGNFTQLEAQELSRNLNLGALPVPISLLSTQTVSPSLGSGILEAGIVAGGVGLIIVVVFLIALYGIAGVVASIALFIYGVLTLALFKWFGFVFTAAGVAGFIISIGMAVDANVLIFERIREELKNGKSHQDAIKEGFKRAWESIRDGNISALITAVVLFYLTTSLVQGFALTLGIGVLISMFSAITVTRTFLYVFPQDNPWVKKYLVTMPKVFKK